MFFIFFLFSNSIAFACVWKTSIILGNNDRNNNNANIVAAHNIKLNINFIPMPKMSQQTNQKKQKREFWQGTGNKNKKEMRNFSMVSETDTREKQN